MALSGTISGSYNANYDCELRWSATQSITNNTSTIKLQWYIKKVQNYDSYNNSGDSYVTLNIGGSSYRKQVNFDFRDKAVGTTVLLSTYSRTVTHNSNGTLSVSISGTHATGLDSLGTKTLSGTASLNTIARASSISASNMTMGTASTITVTKQNSGFTHRVYYSFGSKSNVEITSGAVSGNVSFTPPLSLASEIPSATSATITIRCVTYNGSSQVGTATKSVKLSVPASVKPTVSSVTLAEAVSGLNAKFGAYVQGQSKISGTVNTTTAYGSAIASYRVEINGAVYTARTFTTAVLKNSGSQSVKVTVTDRRGRTSDAYTATFSVLAYTPPNITSFRVVRYKDASTQSDDGTYIKVFVNGTVTGLSSKNTIALKYKYRLASGTEYTETAVTGVTNYAFTYESGLLSGFNANSSYIFEAELTDYFDTAVAAFTLPTAFATMDILADGTGVAFGKVAETQDCLDIGFTRVNSGRYIYMSPNNDFQKRIFFTNTVAATDAANGVFKHNAYLYGGQSSSEISMGVFDPQNNLRAWAYMQNRKRLYTEVDIFEWKGKSIDRVVESTNADNATSVRVWQDGYCEICGKVDVTPTANTPTRQAITFPKTFIKVPNIQVTPHSSVIGKEVIGCSFSNPLRTGCDIVVTRTNTTGTTVYWCARGFINV